MIFCMEFQNSDKIGNAAGPEEGISFFISFSKFQNSVKNTSKWFERFKISVADFTKIPKNANHGKFIFAPIFFLHT